MQRRSLGRWSATVLGALLVTFAAELHARTEVVAADGNIDSRRPVLVELFTSEGCSSCPPADTLLADLDSLQPVPGARVIVLSEHVTYWDHEGWRDPYSLDSVTERQRWYGDKFGLSQVYTPQAVVNGAVQVLGADQSKLVQAVSAAAADAHEAMTIENAAWTGDGVSFTVRRGGVAPDKSKQVLVAALAEDETETQVKRGENAGKTLHNVAVVRVLKEIGSGTEGVLNLKLPADDKSRKGPMRLVVFMMDKRNGHVTGVAEQTVDD
jgi:hypothetical protein